MKKIFGKNQIIISALAIMIMVAGYLNFVKYKDNTIEEVLSSDTLSENEIINLNEDITYSDNSLAEEDIYAVDDNGNIYSPEESEDSIDVSADIDNSEDSETPGEAILVNSDSTDYFASAKLARDQTRAKNKDTLMEVVESSDVTDDQKNLALNNIINLTETAELENATELLLEAKGFEGVVVSIVDGTVDVVVCSAIDEVQAAQIEDIVTRKAGVSPENIVISSACSTGK